MVTEPIFTFSKLYDALTEINSCVNPTDIVPVLIGVSEDNPSVIKLAALVETEEHKQFVVLSDNVNDIAELKAGTTIVKGYVLGSPENE